MEQRKGNNLLVLFLCTFGLGYIFNFKGSAFYMFLVLFVILLMANFVVMFKEKRKGNKKISE